MQVKPSRAPEIIIAQARIVRKLSKRAVVYSVIPNKQESRLNPGNDEKDKKSLIAIKKSFPPLGETNG